MSLIKDITSGPRAQEAVNWLVAAYVRFVQATGRWSAVHPENFNAARSIAGGAVIISFWHARLPLMWAMPGVEPQRTHVLISAHRDGRLIARVMERLRFKVVTGSSSRGGAQAFRRMIQLIRGGEAVAITPDGPRGPRMRVQAGVVVLAQATGAPILPVSFSARRGKFLRSWDRMQFVWPFSRGVYVFGEPICVPRDAPDIEPYRLALENAMNAITAEADRLMGHEPILPADPDDRREAKP